MGEESGIKIRSRERCTTLNQRHQPPEQNLEEGTETGIPEAHHRTPVYSKDSRRTYPLHRSPGRGKKGACLKVGEEESENLLVRLAQYSVSEDNAEVMKSKSRRQKSNTYEDDLYQPWTCEERNPFTSRWHFSLPRTRMPSHVKTYDGSGDPEDHLKLFQSAAKTEGWAMPTWCHMFNSTLTGNARVWFDKLPKESIDSYEDLRTTSPGCRRCSGMHEESPGFMHGITHPGLIKRLYERIPRSVDEMYRMTTSFLQGEVAALSHGRKKASSSWKPSEGGDKPTFKKGFKNKQRPDQKEYKNYVLAPTKLGIFSLEASDMTGYKNNRGTTAWNIREGYSPDRQRQRGQAPERNSNPRRDGTWRMCVDFKDLNNACPKDCYPLPEIDWKVESLCGIKQTPVLSLPSPRCIKDVQKLNGKLASLNRFLSKSAEKSLPFFKTLKKCTKKSDFQWTQEAEAAFKQMKKLIAELPTLTAPREHEELIIYLAAAKEAISAVLMTDREGKQIPVYFVSRALRGPEVNYTPMEKLVLALLSASKRLKRYFQAHTIIVITDQPIKQLLSSSAMSGRMLKWKFELEGYDIQYKPRTIIKGQILADFIVERPEEESSDELMAEPEELPEP
ncbi:reverse transcriptase domain-containing protein [Tanacetum coccineum]|uniref:Reverse transcriptase domain-containing protein n=1 Tax=Tanacetum coccineum TaxID=301880 RepID=A0ABQ4WD28_9ASTR